MLHRWHRGFLILLGVVLMVPMVLRGQQPGAAANDPLAATASLPQGELDALLAPIALYPDQLLAQVLMASTYPLEIVMAGRFVQQNPSLVGDALDQALRGKDWDPSVLSLAAYPQVLLMLNDKLDWTQRLGDAFLANQQQVMDTVQDLRKRAQAAGNLQSTRQQSVMSQEGSIDIEPAQPQFVYVPVYDPRLIYGPWSDPIYQPDYWYPPAIYGYPDLSAGIAVGIFFGAGWGISHNHWGWARPNWRRHNIDIHAADNTFTNRPQNAELWRDGQWRHVPEHRHGVAYRDRGTQDRYIHGSTAAVQARELYRARDLAPPVRARPERQLEQGMVRPLPQLQPGGRQLPQEGTLRPDAQPPARPMIRPQQSIGQRASGLQPSQRAPPQRSVTQPAYYPQPRAQVQMDAGRGQMSRQTSGTQSAPQRGQR